MCCWEKTVYCGKKGKEGPYKMSTVRDCVKKPVLSWRTHQVIHRLIIWHWIGGIRSLCVSGFSILVSNLRPRTSQTSGYSRKTDIWPFDNLEPTKNMAVGGGGGTEKILMLTGKRSAGEGRRRRKAATAESQEWLTQSLFFLDYMGTTVHWCLGKHVINMTAITPPCAITVKAEETLTVISDSTNKLTWRITGWVNCDNY